MQQKRRLAQQGEVYDERIPHITPAQEQMLVRMGESMRDNPSEQSQMIPHTLDLRTPTLRRAVWLWSQAVLIFLGLSSGIIVAAVVANMHGDLPYTLINPIYFVSTAPIAIFVVIRLASQMHAPRQQIAG